MYRRCPIGDAAIQASLPSGCEERLGLGRAEPAAHPPVSGDESHSANTHSPPRVILLARMANEKLMKDALNTILALREKLIAR